MSSLDAADLREAVLRKANLSFVSSIETNFQGAKLEESNLQHAVLRNADLREADMRKADLTAAILERVVLTGADLQEALLRDTDLTGAHFDGRTRWPQDFNAEAMGAIRVD